MNHVKKYVKKLPSVGSPRGLGGRLCRAVTDNRQSRRFPWAAKTGGQGTRTGEEGWTFVETIVVIGIVLILTSTVGFMAFRYIDKAKQAAARNQIEMFNLALNMYLLDCKQYPSQEQGLMALWEKPHLEPVPAGWSGPYIGKKVPFDPWGVPYRYQVPGVNGLPFGISSMGSDNLEGGEGNAKDILSWEDS